MTTDVGFRPEPDAAWFEEITRVSRRQRGRRRKATGERPWDLQEFAVEGTACRVDDPATRATANAGSAFPRDDHIVHFELGVEAAMNTVFGADGRPHRERWRAR